MSQIGRELKTYLKDVCSDSSLEVVTSHYHGDTRQQRKKKRNVIYKFSGTFREI